MFLPRYIQDDLWLELLPIMHVSFLESLEETGTAWRPGNPFALGPHCKDPLLKAARFLWIFLAKIKYLVVVLLAYSRLITMINYDFDQRHRFHGDMTEAKLPFLRIIIKNINFTVQKLIKAVAQNCIKMKGPMQNVIKSTSKYTDRGSFFTN